MAAQGFEVGLRPGRLDSRQRLLKSLEVGVADLQRRSAAAGHGAGTMLRLRWDIGNRGTVVTLWAVGHGRLLAVAEEVQRKAHDEEDQIGRASCRERVCQYV